LADAEVWEHFSYQFSVSSYQWGDERRKRKEG
jgi:hypothetical protein